MNRSREMLLALVRSALWGGSLQSETFAGASHAQWEQTIRLAARQGVTALAFHSVATLPDDLRPAQDLHLGWALNAHRLTKRHRKQEAVAGELAELLEKHAVRTMVLKGLGLARYYPRPHLREYGDLDIWLFGQDRQGDRIVRQMGIPVRDYNAKHSQFVFQGVLVENHRTFLDETLYAMDRRLDKKLETILKYRPCREERIGQGRIYLPPSDFNALFLIRHTAMHFTEGLSLRHLVDWACFLSIEGRRLKATDSILGYLRKEHLEHFAGLLSAIACLQLGLPRECSPFPVDPYRKQAERIWEDILAEKPQAPGEHRRLTTLAFKARRFITQQKRYRIVYGRFSFPHRVVLSIKSHLRHPETIFGNRIKSPAK